MRTSRIILRDNRDVTAIFVLVVALDLLAACLAFLRDNGDVAVIFVLVLVLDALIGLR